MPEPKYSIIDIFFASLKVAYMNSTDYDDRLSALRKRAEVRGETGVLIGPEEVKEELLKELAEARQKRAQRPVATTWEKVASYLTYHLIKRGRDGFRTLGFYSIEKMFPDPSLDEVLSDRVARRVRRAQNPAGV
jgi:hypothetical protein